MLVITLTSCFPEYLLSTSAQTVGKTKSGQPLQKKFTNMRIERWIIFGIQMIDPSLYKQKRRRNMVIVFLDLLGFTHLVQTDLETARDNLAIFNEVLHT